MSTDKRTIDWYNNNAEEYVRHVRDENDSVNHSFYEKPAMYSLLPELKGKSVLSIGCGSGEDCNQLSLEGGKVTGVDISESLIKIAKDSYPQCVFSVMDMEKLEFDDDSFDFAYSSLAIHYLEDWTKALKEIYRILKPGSSFLFSCGHPVYSAAELTQADDEIREHQLSRRKNKILENIVVTGDYVKRKSMNFNDWIIWHKSIGEISADIAEAGFVIELIHEPKPLVKMKEIAPSDYAVLTKIPIFIIFKLKKI